MNKKHTLLAKNLVEKLKELHNGDIETDHIKADDLIMKFLQELGFSDVVAEFEQIEKWYA